MTRNSCSVSLATLWVAGFALAMCMPLYLMLADYVEVATALASMEQVGSLYAPYLGVILAYVIVERTFEHHAAVPLASFAFAMTASVFWNGLVWVFLGYALLEAKPLDEVTAQAVSIASKFSWLVAPMMGYYFAKSSVKSPQG